MDTTRILSEIPIFSGYPRNIVEVRMRDGGFRTLYVNTPLLYPSGEQRVRHKLEDAVKDYIQSNEQALEATIYEVPQEGERNFVASIAL